MKRSELIKEISACLVDGGFVDLYGDLPTRAAELAISKAEKAGMLPPPIIHEVLEFRDGREISICEFHSTKQGSKYTALEAEDEAQ